MGLEPTAYGLGSHRSTTELIPQKGRKSNEYIQKNDYFCKIIQYKQISRLIYRGSESSPFIRENALYGR